MTLIGNYFFQYGRVNIAEAQKTTRSTDSDEDEGYSEETNLPEHTNPPNGIKKEKNGCLPQQNGNNLISRDDKLILVPEPPQKNGTKEDESKLSDDENNKNGESKVS